MNVAQEKIRKWREDPRIFVREVFGVEPDAWQDDVLEAFPHKNRIAMKACKGPGKTTVLAWLIWNFLATRPHPNIAATSITSDNLSDGLWKELAKWHNQSEFLKQMFQWTKTRIVSREHAATWWCSARTFNKAADPTQQSDTLAGLHADYMLAIIDEVGGIPDAVMATVEAILATGIETKIVIAGNPTHTDGPLYRACTSERHLWFVVEITGDPDDPKRSPRIDPKWAKEQIEKYGRENPWVLVNVFGKFPPSSMNTLLGPEEVRAAMKRAYRVNIYNWSQKRLGIDVARFGDDRCHDDKTEILTNEGWKLFCDLKGKEKVFSVEKDKASWEDIECIHSYDYDGELNLFEKKHLNFCITDNHRMFVRRNPKSNKYVIKPYRDLPGEFVVRENNGWSGISDKKKEFVRIKRMPNSGIQALSYSFDMKDWSEFLGWFVSEGNVYVARRRDNEYRIIISQYPGYRMNAIQNLITRMNLKWRMCSNGTQLEFSNRSIGEYLIKECGVGACNKRVPIEIRNGSEDIIQIFLDAFLLGDGTKRSDNTGRCYVTSSKFLADDIQEMLVKLGKAGLLRLKNKAGTCFFIGDRKVIRKNDTYIIYERSNFNGKNVSKKDIKKLRYKGKVWCVATKYESICTRRKGVVMWGGNTVIFPRQGLQAFMPATMRHKRDAPVSVDISNRVIMAKVRWGSELEIFDDTVGWAHGAIDNMRAAGYSPLAVAFHLPSVNPRYKNNRAYMWFMMAEWIKKGGSIPNIPELVSELTTPTYIFKNGKFQLEPKDQIKDRMGWSPDLADALCLTFNIPDVPREELLLTQLRGSSVGGNKTQHEWDPFDDSRK